MHLVLDGIDPASIGSHVVVVAIIDAAQPDSDGEVHGVVASVKTADESAGQPVGVGPASIIDGDGGFELIAEIRAVGAAPSPFAWAPELYTPTTDADIATLVAEWTTVITAGARVLVTRHVHEARRVAVMMSDLLAAREMQDAS